MKKLSVSLIALVLMIAVACNKNITDKNVVAQGDVTLDLPDVVPEYFKLIGNQGVTDNINHIAQLGRVLFYDKQMSLNNATACADCHKQEFAFSDNVRFSRGFENKLTGRNSMAIQNMGNIGFVRQTNGQVLPQPVNASSLFWDGRETSLKNLVLRPISNHVEMGIRDLEQIPAKLQALPYYNGLFVKAYGDGQITLDRISESVATFLLAIKSDDSKLDQFKRGDVQLTALETYGRHLFNTKYNCGSCHIFTQGPYTPSLQNFSNTGLDEITKDNGAGDIMNSPSLEGSFKAPNLRNVAVTGPYMHDGRFETLEHVIEHYSKGIKDNRNLDGRLRSPDGKPMKMNITDDEKKALVAFLRTFTDYTMLTDTKYRNPFQVK